MNSYYLYTIGKPRVTRTSSGGVSGCILSINYDVEPEKKKCPRRLKRCQTRLSRADSNDGKFRLPGLPAIFARDEDALARKKDFQDRVEDIFRGNFPLRSRAVSAPPPMPRQLQAALRDTRAMNMNARHRQSNAKLSRNQRQTRRRAEWQCYRDTSIAYLQHHIVMENVILLLEDPPPKNMNVLGHVSELTQKRPQGS